MEEGRKIYVIGIGPGDYRKMTIEAAELLEQSETIIGYTVYIDLVRKYFPEKEMLSTPMKQEMLRCHMAFEEAAKGKRVAMICSGDAGVYGMAGLMLEIGREYPEVEVEVVPGVTAATAGAAVLGAPLVHDFAVISLSDLLTPWEKIERRILGAAMADFVICLYNPSSKKRRDYLKKACDLMLSHKEGNTVCGVVSHIGRDGEKAEILTLRELRDREADMFTTIFIGNSQTAAVNGTMITPRGYGKVPQDGEENRWV
ncbi:precorrin-3B C(17)-methyltransferase [Lachnospiraceae bacterium 62-35]